jgi:two-component system chemotaxis response regulator CheY
MTRPAEITAPRVLSVGQCGFDHRAIAAYLVDRFGAGVERADSPDEAWQALRGGHFDLVLVNRVLDLDDSSGLELIRRLKGDPDRALAAVPVILVSNYPEAQQAAAELGACPGFGKSELRSPATYDRLKALLG